MTLTVKRGDLFYNAKAPCVIVHGCNAQGKMKSGFADKLRNWFPEAYMVYKKAEEAHGLKVGDINGFTDHRGYTIINAITQEYYGRDPNRVYVDYDGVEKALATVANHYKDKGQPIHLPFIGGGLANGDRETLMGIFERVFADPNLEVTLWLQ